jgi:hypothetical protein
MVIRKHYAGLSEQQIGLLSIYLPLRDFYLFRLPG